MSQSIVTEVKFNELVESTTRYLQGALDRIAALEKEVAALKAKPARGKKDGE